MPNDLKRKRSWPAKRSSESSENVEQKVLCVQCFKNPCPPSSIIIELWHRYEPRGTARVDDTPTGPAYIVKFSSHTKAVDALRSLPWASEAWNGSMYHFQLRILDPKELSELRNGAYPSITASVSSLESRSSNQRPRLVPPGAENRSYPSPTSPPTNYTDPRGERRVEQSGASSSRTADFPVTSQRVPSAAFPPHPPNLPNRPDPSSHLSPAPSPTQAIDANLRSERGRPSQRAPAPSERAVSKPRRVVSAAASVPPPSTSSNTPPSNVPESFEHAKLKKDLMELRTKDILKDTTIEKLKGKLAKLESQSAILDGRVTTLTGRLNAVTSERDEAEQSENLLKITVQQLRADVADLAQKHEGCLTEIEEMTLASSDAAAALANEQEMVRALKEREAYIDSREREIADLRRSEAHLQSDYDECHRNLVRSRASVAQLQSELTRSKDAEALAQDKLDESRTAFQQLDSISRADKELIARLRMEQTDYENELSALRLEAASYRDAGARAVEELETKTKTLEDTVGLRVADRAVIISLQTKQRECERQVAGLEGDLAQSREAEARAVQSRADATRVQDEDKERIASLERQHTEYENEIARLTSLLSAEWLHHEDDLKASKLLNDQLGASEHALMGTRALLKAAEADLTHARVAVGVSDQLLNAAKNESSRVSGQLDDARVENARLSVVAHALEGQKVKLQRALDAKTTELQGAQQEHIACFASYRRSKARVEELQARLDQQTSVVGELQRQLDTERTARESAMDAERAMFSSMSSAFHSDSGCQTESMTVPHVEACVQAEPESPSTIVDASTKPKDELMAVKEELVDQDFSVEDTNTLSSLLDAFAMLQKCGITVPPRECPVNESSGSAQR